MIGLEGHVVVRSLLLRVVNLITSLLGGGGGGLCNSLWKGVMYTTIDISSEYVQHYAFKIVGGTFDIPMSNNF